MICDNISINEKGHLCFAGRDTVELAEKYGTPLYLMDEEKIRENCRVYVNALKKYFGENALPIYASKANSFKRIYAIINEEGMGSDVVSSGEIYTAKKAGFPMEKTFFHSNNKTDADVEFAMENGVGFFVADNSEELDAINSKAKTRNIRQKVLLRLTPGIDPHTFAAVATGKVDSKFGAAIETGQAEELTKYALSLENIDLQGFHCHVGSQVFDSEVYIKAAEIMLSFVKEMLRKYSFETKILDIGGGYGVRYTESNPHINIDENIRVLSEEMKKFAAVLGIELPAIMLEPGRSIVADAGMTLYTVGTLKKIPGYKCYVSIDGGMTDNPRYALYGSAYTVMIANKANEKADMLCTVAGRCCESGDLIQENISLTSTVKRGDICAVLTTGAYNYSMASNYNRLPRPPIIMIDREKDYIAVKRETFDDIISNDV